MFDSVVAAVSPQRARLAGPVSALAHGLVFAGLAGATLWNAADLQLPAPPEPMTKGFPTIPIALISPAGGGGGGHPGTATRSIRRSAAVRASSFPSRIPDALAGPSDSDLTDDQGPQEGVVGDPPGDEVCPTCTGSDVKNGVVDAGVVSPILVLRVEPIYPETARKLRQDGRVALEAIIGRNGSIEEARIVSSTNALFDEAALKAVGQWRYEPCLLAGRPVRVRLLVTVSFRLN